MCAARRETQAIFFRRRHQPRRPALAKIRPGRPAPETGPGTGAVLKANNQLVPKTGCPRQTEPRSKGLAEAILPIAIQEHARKIGSRTCASASCGDIRWIRGTEIGSTHGIDSSGSTRRKTPKGTF